MENMKKIQICTEVQYDSLREKCSLFFNKLAEPNCTLVPEVATKKVCSEKAATDAEASVVLDLKLLELGKTLKGLRESPANKRTVRFCSLIHAEREGRWVSTGEGKSRETLPLLHRETHEICGESTTLEGARACRETNATEFAKTSCYLRYRDPALKKTADDEAKRIRDVAVADFEKHINGRIF